MQSIRKVSRVKRAQQAALGFGLRSFARFNTLGPTRRLLLIFAVMFMATGMAFLVSPVRMASVFGMLQLLPEAITDIRAFYGTMVIAFGLYFLREAWVGESVIPALQVVIVFAGGSVVGRMLGMAIDGSAGGLHVSLMAGELACVWFARQSIAMERRRRIKPVMVENPTQLADFRPLEKACLENPYPFYKAMREQCPVYQAPGNDFYYVSRYDDIRDVVMNTEDYSSNLVAIIFAGIDGETTMVDQPKMGGEQLPVDVLAIQDPPRHGTQRKLGLQNLSLRYVESLEPSVRVKANTIIDRFIARGECDWVQEFAKEIPMTVALDLVGFPLDNWRKVKHWCDEGIALLSGVNTPEQFAEHAEGSMHIIQYVKREYERMRDNPDGRDNFTTALIAAVKDPAIDFTEAEAISMVFQVIIAGSDSSANTIGNAVKMLAELPDVQLELRENPSRIPAFIEEVLRLESPFQGHFRQVKKECVLNGVVLPEGTRLMLLWASANRDEAQYDHPDVLDMDRPNLKAHLAFGRGIHQCLGAQLARLEVRIALEEMLRRTRLIVLNAEQPSDHVSSVFVRELNHLAIRFSPIQDAVSTAPKASAAPASAGCPMAH
ncbi:MAG TPA: cytochrome P450 [Pseudomonadales bacterium]